MGVYETQKGKGQKKKSVCANRIEQQRQQMMNGGVIVRVRQPGVRQSE